MDHRQLLNDLLTAFDEKGLQELCSRLEVDPRELEGRDRGQRAYKLIKLIARQGRGEDLVGAMLTFRPELAPYYAGRDTLSWLDEVAIGASPLAEELPTQAWSESEGADAADSEDSLAFAPHLANEEGPTLTWPGRRGKNKINSRRHDHGHEAEGNHEAGKFVRFVGRQQERAELTSCAQGMVSCAVVGPPGIGKSALLKQICFNEHFPPESKILFAYVDPASHDLKDVGSLHDAVLARWYRQLLDAPPPTAPTVSDFSRQVRTLHTAGFTPIICLDHFEAVISSRDSLDADVYDEWRVMVVGSQLSFLTGSRDVLPDIFRKGELTSDFPRGFRELRLGLLDEGGAQEMLNRRAELAGIGLTKQIRDLVVSICGRYPFYLELAISVLVEGERAGANTPSEIRSALLEKVVPFWRKTWLSLTPLQRSALVLPETADVPLVLARQHKALEQMALIERIGDRHRYLSEAFGSWIAQQDVEQTSRANSR